MRLIDADVLYQKVKMARDAARECGAYEAAVFYDAFCEEVEQAKTVDAVVVVRCKGCKFFHEYEDGETYCEQIDTYGMLPEGFCSEGEKC